MHLAMSLAEDEDNICQSEHQHNNMLQGTGYVMVISTS